jgi:hypothetical protein
MANPEDIEKVRQAIMRFRELLNVMRLRLESGERAYERLFVNHPRQDGLKEKERQWQLAEDLVHDLTPLSKAVVQVRFDARELERAFEELYNIIVTTDEAS